MPLVGIFGFTFIGSKLISSKDIAVAEGRSDSFSSVEEPITKVSFPTTVEGYESGSSVHWLVGISVRCMMGFCSLSYARAYSYGIYISQQGLVDLKQENELGLELTENNIFQQIAPKESVFKENKAKNIPVFIESVEYKGKKAGYKYVEGSGYSLMNKAAAESLSVEYPSGLIRLIMLRDVKCDHVARGFGTTFKRRLKNVYEENKEFCEEFLEIIKADGNWEKGTILEVLRLPEGRMEVMIDGDKKLTLTSEAVSFALFDAYIGENGHLSSSGRKNFVERCDEIIRML